MRALLILALAGCTRAPSGPTAPPTKVVLFEDASGKEMFVGVPAAAPQDLGYFGCTIADVKGWAAIRCPDYDTFVRFHCADLPGPEHAVEFLVKAQGFKLYCR